MRKFFLFLFLFLLSFKSFCLEVTLTQGTIKPTPIAITELYSSNNNSIKIGKNISEVIADNLKRSGLFIPIDKKAFIQSNQSLMNFPRFEDWKIIKAQHLVAGKISKIEGIKLSGSLEGKSLLLIAINIGVVGMCSLIDFIQ